MSRLTIFVILANLVASGRAEEVRFSPGPTAVRTGDRVKITFALTRRTDVEVAILDAGGKVVRHLAAGVLGRNPPPAPLRPGLFQELVWDGRDDLGKPARGGPFRVRCRVGLGAELDRMLPSAPGRLVPPTALGVGPGGEVYVLANRDSAGGVSLYVLDRQGKYLRTILPPPANLENSRLKDVERLRLADGSQVPLVYQAYTADFAPFLSGIRRQQLAVTSRGWVVFASGGNNWTDQAVPRHALVVKTDGSTPQEVGFVGPRLGPHSRYSIGLRPQQLAVHPDGKTLYFVGMGRGKTPRDEARGIHSVGRLSWQSTRGPEPLIGDPDLPGCDATHLNAPVSLNVDPEGNLYVVDAGNDRIAVFDPAGEFLGETKVAQPWQVCVHPKRGTMYVLTQPEGRRWQPFALIKFDKAVAGRELARLDLHGRHPVFALDAGVEPPRLWLAYDPGWEKPKPLLPVIDRGSRLVAGEDVLSQGPGGFYAPLFLDVDPARRRLYVADFRRKICRVDLDTEVIEDFLEASEAVVDRQGNLYVLSGYGTDELLRLSPEGKPLAFAGTGSHRIEVKYRAGLPHVGVRGLCVAPDGQIYVFQDNNADPMHLWRFDSHGKFRGAVVENIPPDSANGVAVDRAGNLYVGINVQDLDALYPRPFEGLVPRLAWFTCYPARATWYGLPHRGVPGPPWNRMYINFYLYHYGSVFKFGPQGGRFWIGDRPTDGDNPRPGDVPADAEEYRTAYFRNVVWCRGALWRYRGFGLCANRTESWGDPACSCLTSRFDMDEHGRLFLPDVFRFSVAVVDSAGNEITRFGAYGNVDSAGPASPIPTPDIPFGSPNAVAVAGDKVYVADRKNRRVAVIGLTHAAERTCPIP